MTCLTIDFVDDLPQVSLAFVPNFGVHGLLEFMPIQWMNSNIFNINLKNAIVFVPFVGRHLLESRLPFFPGLSKRLAPPVQNQVSKYFCVTIVLIFIPKHEVTSRRAIFHKEKGVIRLS